MLITRNNADSQPAEGGARVAAVSYAAAGSFGVVAEGEYRSPVLAGPVGWRGVPPQGRQVLLLPTQDGTVCLGELYPPPDLIPGEILIAGPSGSCIRLRNDGCVEINGAVFSPTGQLTQPAQEG